MRQLRWLLPALAVFSACGPRDRGPEGSYVLRTVGADSLPLLRPGHIPGEGTELKAVTLALMPGGQFTARVDLAITDSGTVEVVERAVGRWERRGDSLFLGYRWCPVPASADSVAARDTARLARGSLVLYRVARLGPETFGPDRPLHFRRR